MHDGQMVHLNGDFLCSIWIETTGRHAGYHDLIRVCVMQLDNFIEPANIILPFYMDLVPKRPENVDYKELTTTKEMFFEIANKSGLDPYIVADRFDEWFQHLKLRFGKKIIPLCYDWAYVRDFLIDWLGWESTHQYFSEKARDVQIIASSSNDKANHHAEPALFPKTDFPYLCSQMVVDRKRGDEAITETYTLSKLYRRMLEQRF